MSKAPGSGQRGIVPQKFFIPTLMTMNSLQQQIAIPSVSGEGASPVITTSIAQVRQASPVTSVIQQSLPSADLYLCRTSNNATEPPPGDNETNKGKASLELLKESFKELNSTKIKDTLSSFLPDIPGEFDALTSQDTMLRQLLEQRPSHKDYHPLSGHALLGFRLLPGPLPEQYRMDPPSHEPKPSHHRKRKHKSKSIEKASATGGDGADQVTPQPKVKMPSDAYSFIKQEPIAQVPGSMHTHYTPPVSKTMKTHLYPPLATPHIVDAPSPLVGTAGTVAHGIDTITTFPGKKKKKEKTKKEKKDKEKKKKRKKDKHHSQDLPGVVPSQPAPSTIPPHSSQTYTAHGTL